MNKKMNSNSMEHVQKKHFSFNSRKGSSPSEVFLRIWQLFFELMVEVTLEKVYYSKLKFTIVNGTVSVTRIFQFTMVNFTLVNFHDYRGKNKDDPSPITIWLSKKMGGYISSLSKLCLFCWQFVKISEESTVDSR